MVKTHHRLATEVSLGYQTLGEANIAFKAFRIPSSAKKALGSGILIFVLEIISICRRRNCHRTNFYHLSRGCRSGQPGYAHDHFPAGNAFLEKSRGAVQMPPKPSIHPQPDAFMTAMPAYMPSMHSAGIKWICGFPGNAHAVCRISAGW